MYRGLLKYFPDALAEVANVSFVGNQQHNPGEELHWAKEKSRDHADCIVRHLVDAGKVDDDGLRHSAKVAWRALALLQIELEESAPIVGVMDEDGDATATIAYNASASDIQRHFAEVIVPDSGAGIYITNDVVVTPPDPISPTFEEMDAGAKEELEGRVAEGLRNADAEIMRLCEEGHFADQMRNGVTQEDRKVTVEIGLVKLGCPPEVAKQVVGGVTFPTRGCVETRWVYIAGPMRGHPDFNYPAFDAARDACLRLGYHVISPADIDRATELTGYSDDQTRFALRDFWALYFIRKQGDSNGIALLQNWPRSVGATAEYSIAKWLDLDVLDHHGNPHPDSHEEYISYYD
jgi:hypothetical protein